MSVSRRTYHMKLNGKHQATIVWLNGLGDNGLNCGHPEGHRQVRHPQWLHTIPPARVHLQVSKLKLSRLHAIGFIFFLFYMQFKISSSPPDASLRKKRVCLRIREQGAHQRKPFNSFESLYPYPPEGREITIFARTIFIWIGPPTCCSKNPPECREITIFP